ncbi:hypothetical protein HAX54_035829 [Datura stramonium]|uniref:Glyceraldehyde 3-phosphate dehydrogenase NAD(P) binding domain-containing protein n=1 Tax=Datura stramonium TaxID=4076 RepID=A0ABS8RMV8_DATST|nr:hypothetical protein [Datura stramonium]
MASHAALAPSGIPQPQGFTSKNSHSFPTQKFEVAEFSGLGSAAPVKGEQLPSEVAINGFGRRWKELPPLLAWHKDSPLDVIVVNDSGGVKNASHLLKYDSMLGTFKADVKIVDNETISVDGKHIKVVSNRDPLKLPWAELGAGKHIQAGAKKVIITAPAKGAEIPTYVVGVNEQDYTHEVANIIRSIASVNDTKYRKISFFDRLKMPISGQEVYLLFKKAIEINVPNLKVALTFINAAMPLAPPTAWLHLLKSWMRKFGIVKGTMTTTHSYTGDQRLLDASHRDLRRARAAALNIVPTSTGAAKAVSLVLPQLKDELNGIALRVPTPNVSVVDLVINVEKKGISAEDVNAAFRKAADGPLNGILDVCDIPLVSVDFRCSDVSTIDSSLTMVYETTWSRPISLPTCGGSNSPCSKQMAVQQEKEASAQRTTARQTC